MKAIKSESYEFKDNSSFIIQHSSLFYYRLKLIDLDGKYQYSKIISIANDANNEIVGNFYPNPTSENFAKIDIISNQKIEWVITSINGTGKILKTEKRILEKGLNKIQINGLEKGVNMVLFENGGISTIRKVIR